MRNLFKNKRIILPIVTVGVVLTAVTFAANPGDSSDPLISLSYFENKIETLKTTLLEQLTDSFSLKFSELEKNVDKTLKDVSENGVTTPSEFKVITLNEGETITCEASTEIIVRSGKSVIVTSENSSGGISDITLGKDLVNGDEITNNHLLIVPKSDGRGIKATITGSVMIKGKYTQSIEGI